MTIGRTPIADGACMHAPRRCQPCLRRALEIQLQIRREVGPGGKLARLGQTLGGPEAWAQTCDDKIAELLCELVTGLAGGILWTVIDTRAKR